MTASQDPPQRKGGPAAWPVPVDLADPFLGALQGLPEARRPLARALAAALDRGADLAPAERIAEQLGLGAPFEPAPAPAPPVAAEAVPTDEDLVRIGIDYEPALVPAALEQIFGRSPERWPRRAQIAAVAWGATIPPAHTGRPGPEALPPLHRWIERQAPPSARPAARALFRTPPSVWRVVAAGAEGTVLEEVPAWVGGGRCRLRAGSPLPEGLWIARLVPTLDGARPSAAIEVAQVPPAPVLDRWLRVAALAERARGFPIRTVADALRIAGHHVARWIGECGGPR